MSLKTNGKNFENALGAVYPPLDEAAKKDALSKARKIVEAIVGAYDKCIAPGHVGEKGKGIPSTFVVSTTSPAGLVYGRIQSGKTRAMVTSTALAFDNGFKVAIVLTSNNNLLVGQTRTDFAEGLPGTAIFFKTDFAQEREQHRAKGILESNEGKIVIVCPKQPLRLKQLIVFLSKIGASNYPVLIFDDEGDQASLDTNTLKRATKDPTVKASSTHSLLHDPEVSSVRKELPCHVFVSVTGTPHAIVLQNASSRSRPSFITLLEAGKEYVGGNYFFADVDPLDNKHDLIRLIDKDEGDVLRPEEEEEIDGMPEGLKASIRFFVLAASAAGLKVEWPKEGYKYLCHPSRMITHHGDVSDIIGDYLDSIAAAIRDPAGSTDLHKALKDSYEDLKKNMPKGFPSFAELLVEAGLKIDTRKIHVINMKRKEIEYDRYFNFLVGGNTLGRGIALRNLLVTYYVRESKSTNMDTLYQHARMFGYRKKTLQYTKLFLPPQLYDKFRKTYLGDEELRQFIERHGDDPSVIPVKFESNLPPSRKNVLPINNIAYLYPASQIFPNYPLPKSADPARSKEHAEKIRVKVLKGLNNVGLRYPADKSVVEKEITLEEVLKLIEPIRTASQNSWSDKKMPFILKDLSESIGGKILLKIRKADRSFQEGDFIETAVLSGQQATKDAENEFGHTVLWLFDVVGKRESGEKVEFIFPTVVTPKQMGLYMFNKSSRK